MGGIAFILAAISAFFCFSSITDRSSLLSLIVGLAYMIVGFLDDLLKKMHSKNLGLRAWQKLVFQLSIALLVGVYCVRIGETSVKLPFTDNTITLGKWYVPFTVFVFAATVNAVNLTDGLDGLATSTAIPYFLFFGLLIGLQGGNTGIRQICFCLVGALFAYLLFNSSPASVFMGDTGSLALGGFAACVGIFTGNALYIALIGILFVFSVISVIMQVIYYKVTGGKRIFLMSPVHHHFQQKGYSETKISCAYFLVTCVVGCVCLFPFLS